MSIFGNEPVSAGADDDRPEDGSQGSLEPLAETEASEPELEQSSDAEASFEPEPEPEPAPAPEPEPEFETSEANESEPSGWVALDEPRDEAVAVVPDQSLGEPGAAMPSPETQAEGNDLAAIEPALTAEDVGEAWAEPGQQWTEIGDDASEVSTGQVTEEVAQVADEAEPLREAEASGPVALLPPPMAEEEPAAVETEYEAPEPQPTDTADTTDDGERSLHDESAAVDEGPVATVGGATAAAGAVLVTDHEATPGSFSALLHDMFQDLSASHDELMPDIQPVLDERDAVLTGVDEAQDPSALDAVLFDAQRQFPQHITWLRHAGTDISRLRRAELESDDSLASLSRLRDTHVRGAVADWTSTLEPTSRRKGAAGAGSAAGDDSARFGTLKLAAEAAERGPTPLERLLRSFRRGLQLRQVTRWLMRVVWLAVIGALGFAWFRGLLPYAEYAAGGAAVVWLLQEFVLNPRLDRRHFERLQTRTREAIGDYYSARLIALLEMGVIRSQLGRMDET